MRLIQYLKKKYPKLSAREFKRALEFGACTVNGKICQKGSELIDPAKDKIIFKAIKSKAPEKLIIKQKNIIFEDEHLLIYNKEPFYPVMSTSNSKQVNLHTELKKQLKLKYLEPCHRLDKLTSGLVIFAKTKDALSKISQLFKDKKIKKTYQALIDKSWKLKSKTGCIKNYLKIKERSKNHQIWMVDKKANDSNHKAIHKFAITNYKVINSYKTFTHIELEPKTGRTHQLRVHMANLTQPILGDAVYANKFTHPGVFEHFMLHAGRLEFKHPYTSDSLNIFCPTPIKFKKLSTNN